MVIPPIFLPIWFGLKIWNMHFLHIACIINNCFLVYEIVGIKFEFASEKYKKKGIQA